MRTSTFLLMSTIGIGFLMFSLFSSPVDAFSAGQAGELLRSSVLLADPTKVLAAGYGFGLAALGAGVAVGYAGSAAIAAIAEKPNLFGRALVIVVLGEGIAIYGFVIVFILTSL